MFKLILLKPLMDQGGNRTEKLLYRSQLTYAGMELFNINCKFISCISNVCLTMYDQ